jgi:hypothetical protein
LLSTLTASKGLLREGEEAWIPICLPKYNDAGFLFAWIGMSDQIIPSSNLSDDEGVVTRDGEIGREGAFGIVLIGGDKEGFSEMKAWGEKIKLKLIQSKLAEKFIKESISEYGLGKIFFHSFR